MFMKKRQSGFSLVTVIFLITVLAALGAFLLTMSGVAHQTPVMGLRGVQAYHAARSGLEWGIAGAILTGNTASCTGNNVVPGSYTVNVTCSVVVDDDGNSIYSIDSVATIGTPGRLGFARRSMTATASPSPP